MTESKIVERRVTVRYDGMVQGVGFRFTVIQIAESFSNITGYVRNMPDGSVEVVGEGPEVALLEFLAKIKTSHLGRYINKEVASWSPARREYDSFSISYGF